MNDFRTATQMSMRTDLRRLRAMSLLAAIMERIDPYLRDEDGRERRDAHDALYELLHQKGVEIITDRDRAEAGLPPRDQEGWTVEELVALERLRIEAITRPLTMIVPRECVPAGSKLVHGGTQAEHDA